ncbi:hypothetical protein H8356DRAFT_1298558 [Neocallimastix lanati (nom. inval.)]|uniref:Carbohydrate-binding domain-containing protein n=1 Tax=Neocallimastix californiae TaxID=1754190 RepID=A0A1Y2DC94_9FUNG|nr:hypothetical protein H8356DRAFT_1298558 [Neocallimastix sp. JGI-2020a]ORY56764.1 hypothetical protein LY90DRAFT_669320 [Neocallimastix californiae]|eukprot:ORY56764.1 hypothetical protein LY90DRAFT_669320 [Neocallimastix californiae]
MKYNFLLLFLILIIITTTLAEKALEISKKKITLITTPVVCEFKKKDINEDYDIDSDVVVKCQNAFCSSSESSVITSAGLVNITTAGTYIIQGSFYGQVRIDASKNDFVHLVLDDTIISSGNGPAIYGLSADKITITVVGNSTLADSSNYNFEDSEPDACLFSNSDLSINGSGNLVVSGNYGDAIRTKKDLRIVNTNINITNAVKKGIKAKNSLCVKKTTINIVSSDTGIKVTRNDCSSKGYIVIYGGSITISSGKDGIHAEKHLTINDGYIDIKESKEGLESEKIDILGGEIHIMSISDGINASLSKFTNNVDEVISAFEPEDPSNSNDNIYVNIIGGKIYITTKGDCSDGIDSNGILYIGGEAEVYTSIETGEIYGRKAAIDVERTNAIGDEAMVFITTGEVSNNNNEEEEKKEDGSQSNTENNNNETISNHDKNNKSKETHSNLGQGFIDHLRKIGRLFKREGPGPNGIIYHPYIYTNVSPQSSGTQITIKNSDDQVIGSYTPNVSFSTILVTSPRMVIDETYTIILGTTTSTNQKFLVTKAISGALTDQSDHNDVEIDNSMIQVNDDHVEVDDIDFNSNIDSNFDFDTKSYSNVPSNTNGKIYTVFDHNSIPVNEINDYNKYELNNSMNINESNPSDKENNDNSISQNNGETNTEYLLRILGMNSEEIEEELEKAKANKK